MVIRIITTKTIVNREYDVTISSGEIKRNMTIFLDGDIYQILDWQHRQAPKAPPTLTLKLRQVSTGNVIEKKTQGNQRLKLAPTDDRECLYQYKDNGLHYFMDNQTFDTFVVDEHLVAKCMSYIAEGDPLTFKFHDGRALTAELPASVVLLVTQSAPGIKGDTATGATKPATTSTGLTVQVPLFINEGDRITVNTETGTYLGRA